MRSHRRRPSLRLLVVPVILGLLAAACGGGGGSGSGGDGKRKVRLAESIPALSFAPLLVARDKNLFQQQGVEVEYSQLESGATALQALLGGSVDMVNSASTEVAAAAAQRAPVLAIQGTIKMTLEVCASKQWMDQRHVSATSDLKTRLAAFKGAKLGITGPGAVSDRGFRWLLQKYGGLDANKDVVMSTVGGASAMGPALQQGKIQGFLLSPPQCEQAAKDGFGVVLVQPKEVREFTNYIHEVLYTTKSFATKNKDLVSRVAKAVSMGNNLVLDDPDQAVSAMQKSFAKVDPDVIAKAMKESIIPQVPRDGRMTPDMWRDTSTVLTESGTISNPLETTEGTVWTNEYLS